MQFFSVNHNSLKNKKYPWIEKIVEGRINLNKCSKCGTIDSCPTSDIKVVLEKKKGFEWPDVLGIGAYPLLIVSEKTVNSWQKEGVENIPSYRVFIVGNLPEGIVEKQKPILNYYWIDGKRMRGALLDFSKSGYVDVHFCPDCGNRTHNIPATYDRQHKKRWPYVFKENSWNNKHLFTTDISNTKFFCTEKIVNLVNKYSLTNFLFTPIKEGSGL